MAQQNIFDNPVFHEGYKKLRENCAGEKDNLLSVETYCDILVKEYEKLVAR